MNVINFEFYRLRREILLLEMKMSDLARKERGSAGEMKTCFKEWLVKTGSL